MDGRSGSRRLSPCLGQGRVRRAWTQHIREHRLQPARVDGVQLQAARASSWSLATAGRTAGPRGAPEGAGTRCSWPWPCAARRAPAARAWARARGRRRPRRPLGGSASGRVLSVISDLRTWQRWSAGARRRAGPAAAGASASAGVWARARRARGLRQLSHAGGDGRWARLVRLQQRLRQARPRQQDKHTGVSNRQAHLCACLPPPVDAELTGSGARMAPSGTYHCVAAAAEGDVFTWGAGAYGSLVHNSEPDRLAPARLERGQFGRGRVVLVTMARCTTRQPCPRGAPSPGAKAKRFRLTLRCPLASATDLRDRLVPTPVLPRLQVRAAAAAAAPPKAAQQFSSAARASGGGATGWWWRRRPWPLPNPPKYHGMCIINPRVAIL